MSKKYLVVKGHCGLGNRLQTLVGAKVYAEATGRKLIIDWSDGMYGEKGRNVFPEFFSLEGASYSLNEVKDSESVYPAMWEGNLECNVSEIVKRTNWYPFGEMNLPSCDLAKIDYDQDVLIYTAYVHNLHRIPKHALQKSKYASMSEEQIIKKILNEDLKLNPVVKERIDSFKKGNFHHPIAGVHVRFTDLIVGFSNRAYHKKLKKMIKKNPDLNIFLATDNRKVEQNFNERYKNVLTLDKWLPKQAGKPAHYNCDNDKCFKMGIDALADMYLLGMCDYLVYNEYSTFTFYTRNITGISTERQIALQPGGIFVKIFRETRWALMRVKQRICRILFKRNTLFKTPIRNFSISECLRRFLNY